MLRDSVVVVVVVVVVVRTRPRAIPLAMIAIRKILHGFPFLSRDAYGAPLGGPSGRRSSAIILKSPSENRPLPTEWAKAGSRTRKKPFDVIYYLYKMKQSNWLLCVAKNCDWSRKITPLSNLTRASLLVE